MDPLNLPPGTIERTIAHYKLLDPEEIADCGEVDVGRHYDHLQIISLNILQRIVQASIQDETTREKVSWAMACRRLFFNVNQGGQLCLLRTPAGPIIEVIHVPYLFALTLADADSWIEVDTELSPSHQRPESDWRTRSTETWRSPEGWMKRGLFSLPDLPLSILQNIQSSLDPDPTAKYGGVWDPFDKGVLALCKVQHPQVMLDNTIAYYGLLGEQPGDACFRAEPSAWYPQNLQDEILAFIPDLEKRQKVAIVMQKQSLKFNISKDYRVRLLELYQGAELINERSKVMIEVVRIP